MENNQSIDGKIFNSNHKKPFLFINYRREDSEILAPTLYQELNRVFEDNQIFFDKIAIDSGLPWPEEIKKYVKKSSIMFVLIGEKWLKLQHPDTGERRLDLDDDWVRQEIEVASALGIEVIPIYLNNTEPLKENQLKTIPTISNISKIQGLFLRNNDWVEDLEKIKQKLIKNQFILRAHSQNHSIQAINIPQKNKNFSGRKSLIENIHNVFNSSSPETHIQVLTGLGGIGKSQLAVEYAHEFRNIYPVLWLIRAEDRATLIQDLANLADELELQGSFGPDTQLKVKSVIKWLNNNEKWLLIFDNVEKPDSIRDYLPSNLNGHIIITSRFRSWKALGNVITIPTFSRDESAHFILNRINLNENNETNKLAEKLGDFPLALEQAAAYIENMNISIKQYLELFNSNENIIHGANPATYHESIGTTWEISFKKIREISPLSVDLLYLCAFLYPENIPLNIIKNGLLLNKPDDESIMDPNHFNKIIEPLIKYSLVERSATSLSIHRCVQFVIRDRMTKENLLKYWSEIAVCICGKSFPMKSDDPDAFNRMIWDECSNLLPHILTAATYGQKLNINPKETSNLFAQVASFMREQPDLFHAKQFAEKAMNLTKMIKPIDINQCSICFETYARILRDCGELNAAETYLFQAVSFEKKKTGENYEHMAICYDNLGRVYNNMGKYQQAIKYYEQALKIDQSILGLHHPKIAIRLNNIAVTLIALGEYQRAKEDIEKSLEIEENYYKDDPNHPYIAIRYTTLGVLNQKMGQFDNAIKLYEKACYIIRNFYGKDHPKMAEPLNNLGVIMAEKEDFVKARLYFENAITIMELTYGRENTLLKSCYQNLGEIFLKMNDYENAKQCFLKAENQKSILKSVPQFFNKPILKA